MNTQMTPKGIGAQFKPVRLFGKEAINTYRVVPSLAAEDGSVKSGKSLVTFQGDPLKVAQRNSAVLEDAFKDFTRAYSDGRRLRLIAPISTYALVGKEGATLMVNAIKLLPGEVRANVIIELYDFPPQMAMNTLEDCMVLLFPFFENYIAQPSADMDDYTVFANCNMMGVSLDMDGQEQTGEAAEKIMKHFWAQGTKRRLKLFFEGLNEAAALETANRYEAMGVDGALIGENLETLVE